MIWQVLENILKSKIKNCVLKRSAGFVFVCVMQLSAVIKKTTAVIYLVLAIFSTILRKSDTG